MTPLEKMQELHKKSAETLRQMQQFSSEMLIFSIEYIQQAINAHQWHNMPKTRTLLLTLDACDTPTTNDRKMQALKTQWPDVVISEVIFDKGSNKFFLFTESI